jgi:hypothetical protein
MSVLLSWEHPEQLNGKVITEVVISRLVPGSNSWVTSGTDLVWGFFEDVENDDPNAEYQIEYRVLDGANTQLLNNAIHRMKKTDEHCIVNLKFVDLMGFPAQARKLSLRSPIDSTFRRDLFTNNAGLLSFCLRRNARVNLHLDGDPHALTTVVPNKGTADWAELSARGTVMDADQRGWY